MNRMSNVEYLKAIQEYKDREIREIKEIKERSMAELNKKKPFLLDIYHRAQLKIESETCLFFATSTEKRIYCMYKKKIKKNKK
ncbi:hypothetical protein DDB_G0274711 [Dictyostelium discoideum AX4]|uniref:Uncharacterized protein n=1 Tax=Dictyostelium discoideum TaxID=44689 RepID=Q556E4_DICDI|nr:hypothetical protein DDB_G0274711 [Dictyostelium discoideum AX4]EAL70248.1 hypothetical protein DDB_G0274711 [Dictyostelium discoideum AX4]|eukprot:XP_644023.1 hypothetical protein DDB_G0274711 [Dictyostelium discoideum AX4]